MDLKKSTEDSKSDQDNINRSEEPEPKDPKKQITTEIDQQATPLSTLFSKSQLQMIEKGVQELLTQDDYAEYQSLDSVEAMTHWLNARRAMKSFAAQLDFAYQKLDAFKKKEGDNAWVPLNIWKSFSQCCTKQHGSTMAFDGLAGKSFVC